MAKGLLSYDKYSVRVRNGIKVKKQDGTPEFDEKLSTVRLDEQTVKILNSNWEGFNVYYVLVEDKPKVEMPKADEPEVKEVVVAKVEIPQIDPEKLKETLIAEQTVASRLERLKAMSSQEVDAVLKIIPKKYMLETVGIELTKSQLTQTNQAECIKMTKEKLYELKQQ